MKGLFVIIMLVATYGCASWPYEVIEQEEVTAQIVGDDLNTEERAIIADVIAENSAGQVVSHPSACRRKDCAGPLMEFYQASRDSAVLLIAARQLERANERYLDELPFAPRTQKLVAFTQNRLPELQAEIDEALLVLATRHAGMPSFEEFELARERLEVARLVVTRLDERLDKAPRVRFAQGNLLK